MRELDSRRLWSGPQQRRPLGNGHSGNSCRGRIAGRIAGELSARFRRSLHGEERRCIRERRLRFVARHGLGAHNSIRAETGSQGVKTFRDPGVLQWFARSTGVKSRPCRESASQRPRHWSELLSTGCIVKHPHLTVTKSGGPMGSEDDGIDPETERQPLESGAQQGPKMCPPPCRVPEMHVDLDRRGIGPHGDESQSPGSSFDAGQLPTETLHQIRKCDLKSIVIGDRTSKGHRDSARGRYANKLERLDQATQGLIDAYQEIGGTCVSSGLTATSIGDGHGTRIGAGRDEHLCLAEL